MSTRTGRKAANSIKDGLERHQPFRGMVSFTTKLRAKNALKRFCKYWEAHVDKTMPDLAVCWDDTLQAYMARTPDKSYLIGEADVFVEICDSVIKICLWKRWIIDGLHA